MELNLFLDLGDMLSLDLLIYIIVKDNYLYIVTSLALKKNKNIAASVKLTIIDDKESQLSKNPNPKYIISKEIRIPTNKRDFLKKGK